MPKILSKMQAQMLNQMEIEQDVMTLHKAMKGFGTDEKALISVLGRRTDVQMQQIAACFKASYAKDLYVQLEKETGGEFKNLCVALAKPSIEQDCYLIEKATKGLGTNEELLMEIIGGRTNQEMHLLRQHYQRIYGKSLEKELADELSGDEKKLFIGLIQGGKNETGQGLSLEIDLDQLYQAGEGKRGTDEANFIRIFTTRSDVALRSLFEAYEKKYGKPITKVIKSEFGGTIERMLLALVEIIQNRPRYLAKRFENSMSGIGTKDELLISMAVRFRDPMLMTAIKTEFQTLFKKTLVDRIKGETSGDYEKLLVQLVS